MSATYALIVGVEHYDQADWDVEGPCANALAITEWLLSIGTPEANISLFLNYQRPHESKRRAGQDQAVRLQKRGVRVTESAEWHLIDKSFARACQGCEAESRLFVYWSGHGFVDADGSRVFICEDYTADELNTRVFNCSNFLRRLLSVRYQVFSEQILLADTCAVRSNLEFNAPHIPPGAAASGIRQIAYFATPEGEYAKGDEGRGIFTGIALEALGTFETWPAPQEFSAVLGDKLKQSNHVAFRIGGFDGEREITESVVGSLSPETPIFDSLWGLLSGIDLPSAAFRTHYLRTVDNLGEPSLAKAQGLSGMLRELESLQDSRERDEVPFGLLEFLVRLSDVPQLQAPIRDWIDKNAASQKRDLADVREVLQLEKSTRVLLIEVEHDEKGQISGFQPFLRMQDLSPAPEQPGARQAVTNWEDFCSKIPRVLQALRSQGVKDFEIHFLVDAPLFDRPFHLIPLPVGAGTTLGESFVVILKHRERVRAARAVVRRSWQDYTDALRPTKPRDLQLVKIPSRQDNLGAFLEKKGLCYMSFVLHYTDASTPGFSEEKQIVLRLLNMGFPYLFWLHETPGDLHGDCWQALENSLTVWLKGSVRLSDFPTAVAQRRTGRDAFAYHATLLWDDPQFSPFLKTSGVDFK
jgi:hypothetical protein